MTNLLPIYRELSEVSSVEKVLEELWLIAYNSKDRWSITDYPKYKAETMKAATKRLQQLSERDKTNTDNELTSLLHWCTKFPCGSCDKSNKVLELFAKQDKQSRVEWQSTKDHMPNEGQLVLARLEWLSGKEAYAVLEHKTLDDNEPWLYDGSELSFSVNVTHWKPFDRLASLKQGDNDGR